MNAIITQYKKIVFSVMLFGVMSIAAVDAKCSPCEARKSIRDAAAAAALLAGKPVSREMELDVLPADDSAQVSEKCKPCAAAKSIRDAAAAAALLASRSVPREMELDAVPTEDQLRAAREALTDPCNNCQVDCDGFNVCDLNCKLQTLYNCCVNTNQQVRCQAHDAKKCCKKLSHKIGNVEDQVEDGFSVVETLILSQSDSSAACCSVMEAQMTALGLSIADVFALLTSVFDCTCAL